jgi:hypothetical protein
MLMWTKVLEGLDGLGGLGFDYFVGPAEFARYFGLDGHGDLEKLEGYYDSKINGRKPEAVDRRSFRDYYGLRASVAFSGWRDEWNIVRTVNEKRREADPKAWHRQTDGYVL